MKHQHAFQRFHWFVRFKNSLLPLPRPIEQSLKNFSSIQSVPSSIYLFDSLTEQIQPLPLKGEGKGLAWYTCGPTTYAPAHLGHARTYVWIDILRRVIEAQCGPAIPPLFVMNITDVDDKILVAANQQNVSPIVLARRFEEEFWQDLDALNCLRPHVVTRVTDYVESHIVPFIERLVDQGMAYNAEDGVYFHVKAYNERLGSVTKYGKLAPAAVAEDFEITVRDDITINNSNMMSPKKQKKDPRDFVLWKSKKPEETLAWPSPWGLGRPGWHIECSAMIEAIQAQFRQTHQFIVHAGGIDLKFPHHTNEIAQSEAYRQAGDWIPHWVHTGHLHIDGMKMSKSLKNFITIQDFLADYTTDSPLESPSDDFRFWCMGLSGSYRGPATFSKDGMETSRKHRHQVLRFLVEAQTWMDGQQNASKVWVDGDHQFFNQCQESRKLALEALHTDMNSAEFIRQCLLLVRLGNDYIAQRRQDGPTEPIRIALSILRDLLALVGFTDTTVKAGIHDEHYRTSSSNQVVGGEKALMQAMVQFRSEIRQTALVDAKAGVATENMKRILNICDDVRDNQLPKLGIQLLDGKVEGDDDSWTICLPKSDKHDKTMHESTPRTTSLALADIPLQDLFRMGQYEGQFSAYDQEGIPTHNADGSEVSKRALHKLLKKREAHKARLAEQLHYR